MRCVIYAIAKHYRKITKYFPKTLEGYRKKDMRSSKFLDTVFKEDRENFINTYGTNFQKGRVRSHLNSCYDSTRKSYFEAIENYFLYGWWYDFEILNNGEKFESLYRGDCSTKGLTTNTSLHYAKYLTEKYGKELFVKKEIA